MNLRYVICSEIIDVRDGTHDSPKYIIDGGYPLITSKNINNNKIDFSNVNYISEEDYIKINQRSEVSNGDIIMPMIGTIGNPVIIDTDKKFAIKNVALFKLANNETILSKYFYYILKTQDIKRQLESNKRGGTQNFVSLKNIRDLKIPLIDILEQKKIVEILDKAQQLIDKRKKQIESLDELVKSKFIEMFGDPISNPKGWHREKMNDVAPVVNYKGDFNEEKIWLLNLDMVESNTGKIIDYNYVMKNEIGSSTCTFDTTNVLYSKLRPYLNKVVIPNSIGYATSEMVPLQPLNSKINRYYLTYMLRNKSFVDYISEKVAGAKMPRVSMNDFRNFEVPIPPIELQNQFVDFVKQVDKLKFEMEKSLKELEDNFNSLMQKAFKGELFG